MRMKLSLLTVLIGALLIASAPVATAAPPSAGISGPVTGTCSMPRFGTHLGVRPTRPRLRLSEGCCSASGIGSLPAP